jgi:SAM-dependent methyltransferase
MAPATHRLVEGFDLAASAYERGRPEYPGEAIDLLVGELGLGSGHRAVDLGAGTGKLTRALAARGVEVLAVEPAAGMRAEFARRVPGVPVVDGTAEAIPLPDTCVDAAVSGQAFHWFDVPQAAREISRVVRPRGGVGLVWNYRDESIPWIAELGRIIDAHDPGAPRIRRRAWRAPLEATGRFEPLKSREFRFVHRLDPATVVARALSVSFIAVLPPSQQTAIAAEVRALLARDPATREKPEVELAYRTEVYWTALR